MNKNELYRYIRKNFEEDEPIFLFEIPGKSENAKSQMMKCLVDEGKMERFQNGVYFRNYTSPVGTKGKMSVSKYIEKRYLIRNGETIGYKTGLGLANAYGFTSQNAAVTQVRSNAATTKQRKLLIGNRRLIVYMPVTKINGKNKSALQLLDLVTDLDRYAEIPMEMQKTRLRRFIELTVVDFEEVKKNLSGYPSKTYRSMYERGLIDELV